MEEITILAAIAVFMAGIFAMAGLRLWFITHQDVNMSKKVNGLSIDVGKIKKQLKDGYTGVVQQVEGLDVGMDVGSMDLGGFVEALGFDTKELNNPLIRPLAEKIFKAIQQKAVNTEPDNDKPNIEML